LYFSICLNLRLNNLRITICNLLNMQKLLWIYWLNISCTSKNYNNIDFSLQYWPLQKLKHKDKINNVFISTKMIRLIDVFLQTFAYCVLIFNKICWITIKGKLFFLSLTFSAISLEHILKRRQHNMLNCLKQFST